MITTMIITVVAALMWRSTRAAALLRLLYSALAETLLAGGWIDFSARFRGPCELREAHPITGGTNNFCRNFTRFFHSNQFFEQTKPKSQTVDQFCARNYGSASSPDRNETHFLT
jgi:hypothetical protein